MNDLNGYAANLEITSAAFSIVKKTPATIDALNVLFNNWLRVLNAKYSSVFRGRFQGFP